MREVLRGRVTVDGAPVQIAGVLDDLYADAAHARLGPAWEDGVPSLGGLGADGARRRRCCLRERARGDGARRGRRLARARRAVMAGRRVRVRRRRRASSPTRTRCALTVNSTRSVLAELPPPGDWPKPPPIRAVDASIYELHIRDFSIGDATVPRRAPRDLPRVHARLGAGCATCARWPRPGLTTVHLLPCNDIATIEEDRSRQLDPGPLDHLAARLRRAAAPRRRGARPRRLQLGLRPAALPRARGLLRASRTARASSGRWCARSTAIGLRVVLDVVFNHTPPADSRAGPDRPRLLPPAHADRRDLRLDVLREHRDRAPDDGEADARRARALGARVPRRRLPLRPHGPPHEGQPAGGARAARSGAAPLRRGLELRRGRRRRAVRRRLAEATWPGTGIGTFNDVLRDAVRGGGPHDADPTVPGLGDRATRARRNACSWASPATSSPAATRHGPTTRSPTSTPTTTRRCSTRWRSSSRARRAWTTACA